MLTGGFFGFFSMYCIQHCFFCRPSDSTVSEDAAIEPELLWLRHWQSDALTTRLDLIHNSAIDLIHTQLDLIHILLASCNKTNKSNFTPRTFLFNFLKGSYVIKKVPWSSKEENTKSGGKYLQQGRVTLLKFLPRFLHCRRAANQLWWGGCSLHNNQTLCSQFARWGKFCFSSF